MSKKRSEEREKVRKEANEIWGLLLELTNSQIDNIIEMQEQGIIPITDLRNFNRENSDDQT